MRDFNKLTTFYVSTAKWLRRARLWRLGSILGAFSFSAEPYIKGRVWTAFPAWEMENQFSKRKGTLRKYAVELVNESLQVPGSIPELAVCCCLRTSQNDLD